MLKTYQDFLNCVNKIGYMPLSEHSFAGFPVLKQETDACQWHTGDRQTDPWQWKDRAAEEKELAFGCILGSHKGFVSKKLYPLFYAAYRPEGEPIDAYESGELSRTAWELYRLFENGEVLSTADIRKTFGATKKTSASRLDTALKELQKKYFLTVCGNKRKVSFDGLEYGWPANTYCRVEDWANSSWLAGADAIGWKEAREQLLDSGVSASHNTDREALSKLLFGKGKG